MEGSASCIIMRVGFVATFLILFSKDNGIRLMLDPRSRNVLPTDRFPIDIGIVKLPGSLSFFGFSKMALQSSSRVTMPQSSKLFFLVMRSFKSLDYSSIMSMALVKGMVTLSRLIKSISFLYRCSLSYFVGLRGYNFSHVIACLASRFS